MCDLGQNAGELVEEEEEEPKQGVASDRSFLPLLALLAPQERLKNAQQNLGTWSSWSNFWPTQQR